MVAALRLTAPNIPELSAASAAASFFITCAGTAITLRIRKPQLDIRSGGDQPVSAFGIISPSGERRVIAGSLPGHLTVQVKNTGASSVVSCRYCCYRSDDPAVPDGEAQQWYASGLFTVGADEDREVRATVNTDA